jgi:DNA replication protein DnaC
LPNTAVHFSLQETFTLNQENRAVSIITFKYIRLPDLLDEFSVARGEGIFQKVMQGYKKFDLLILDEWLLSTLTDSELSLTVLLSSGFPFLSIG